LQNKEDIKNLIDNIKGKSVAVIGIGVNNIPLIRFLVSKRASVTAFDKKSAKDLGVYYNDLKNIGVKFSLGDKYLAKLNQKIIFKSPGIPFSTPEILTAMVNGALVTSETEVFMALCPAAIIGVTGSDGKTTTATLCAKMLEQSGVKTWLGGNIGKPLIGELGKITPKDKVVLELSSFQLQNCRVSPDVAVITNISPNHLDYHKDMDEYINAKKNIFLHQDESGLLVINEDNDITVGFKREKNCRIFSMKNSVEHGCYIKDGIIHFKDVNGDFEIIDVNDILLPGVHNIENYMAAIAAVSDFASIKAMKEVAQSFKGVEHRLEFIKEARGVKIYNDSIATSPTRTMAGLKSFDKKVILIAGGYDKHIPFEQFGKDILDYVKVLHLTGDTTEKIEKCVRNAGGDLPIKKYGNLAEATKAAFDEAGSGDIVLFSPACASFDKFRNFEERGNYFKRVVEELH